MHPEIATAALVQLCQVVLLCKYISNAVSLFSPQKLLFLSHKTQDFSLLCAVMHLRRRGSVISNVSRGVCVCLYRRYNHLEPVGSKEVVFLIQ